MILKMNKLELGPGERGEIVIDFSKYDKGTTLSLTGGDFNVLKFNVKDDEKWFHFHEEAFLQRKFVLENIF